MCWKATGWVVLMVLVSGMLTGYAQAASGTWANAAGGSWTNTANWQSGNIADGADSTATFGNVITSDSAVTLDGDRTIGNITASDTGQNYSISGVNTLTLDRTDATPPTINVTTSGRILTISSVIAGNDGLAKAGAGTLILSNAGNTYAGGVTISGGQLRMNTDAVLGDTSGGIVFAGTALLSTANDVTLAASRTITINSGIAIMGDSNVNNNPLNFTINGKISGSGGVQCGHYQLGTGQTYFNNTANDFTGSLTLGKSAVYSSYSYSTFTLNIASLTDGVGYGNIVFGQGNNSAGNTAIFSWSSSAVAPLVLNYRRIQLDSSVESAAFKNNSGNAANTLTINTDMQVSRAGNKTFILGGNNAGANTFAGAITNGAGSVIGVTKADAGKWILSGTNTYTGGTTCSLGSGTLVFQGTHSAPSGRTITLNQLSSSTSAIRLLADGAGTNTFASTVAFDNRNSGTSIGLLIGNTGSGNGGSGGGTTTGATIAVDKFRFIANQGTAGSANGPSAITINNGYTLAIGAVQFASVANIAANWKCQLVPVGGSIMVTGTVQQDDGNTTTADYVNFTLDGTSTGNLISGSIKDAADYPSNANAMPLRITKSNASEWTFSGTNSYSGVTTISAGKLFVNGNQNAATGNVSVAGSAAVGGSGSIGGEVTLSGTSSIDLRDDSVATLTLATNLNLNGAAGANNLYFDLGNAGGGVDKIVVTGNVVMATSGAGVINLTQLSGVKIDAGTYDLIDAKGTMPVVSYFTLATTAAFGNVFSLQLDGTGKILQLVVAVAPAAPAVAIWKGDGASNNWSTDANWVDGAGAPLGDTPGYATDVSFYASGAARLATGVLDTGVEINSLTYAANATANTTIGGSPNMLTLASGSGITVNTPSSGSPAHTVTVNVGMTTNQEWTVSSGAALTVSGVVSDLGGGYSLAKAGAGACTLNGLNTYSGATTIKAGTLAVLHTAVYNVTTPNVFGMSPVDPGNLVLNPGTTLKFNISSDTLRTTDRGFTLNGTVPGDSVTIDASGAGTGKGVQFTGSASPAYGTPNQTRTLILAGTHAASDGNRASVNSIDANIANNGTGAVSLIKNNAGRWRLGGSCSYTGGTTINGGILCLAVANRLPAGGGVTLANTAGAMLDLSNLNLSGFSQSIGVLSGGGSSGGNIRLGSGTLTVNQATGSEYAGEISGTGSFIKSGAGALTLSGVNTYAGATTINGGTLQIGNGSATLGTLGANSGNTSVANGAVLKISRTGTAGDALAYSGAMSGNGTVEIVSGGRLDFTANQASSGTLVFQVDGTLAIRTGGGDLVTAVQLGELKGSGDISRGGVAGGAATVSVGAKNTSSTFSGTISASELSLAKVGTGTLTLSGNNTYGGSTTVSAGTLQLGAGGTTGSLPATSAISVGAGSVFAVNQTDTVTQGTDFSTAAITGAGGVTQAGSGTTVLNAANTYTGVTTINAGTLVLGADNTLDTDNNIILAGGTLSMGSYANGLGTLAVTGSSNIALGSGSLSFTDSSAVTWTHNLDLTGSLGATTLRFGTNANGLTTEQLARLTIGGSRVTIDSDGYILFVELGSVFRFK